MKIAGYIIAPLGVLAFIGTLLGGHSPIGPLFWIVVGITLLILGYRKEKLPIFAKSLFPMEKCSQTPQINTKRCKLCKLEEILKPCFWLGSNRRTGSLYCCRERDKSARLGLWRSSGKTITTIA